MSDDGRAAPVVPSPQELLAVDLIGERRRVLELGPADGSIARILRSRGCSVTALGVDPTVADALAPHSERTIVGDLDRLDLGAEIGDARFDVVLAADVLQTVRYPVRCLSACTQFIAPDGEIVLSLPNSAHADIRLALLDGIADIQLWGIVDGTHLRFLTRALIGAFLDSCGLAEVEVRRVIRPIGTTELAPRLNRPAAILDELEADPESETWRFIVRAIPYRDDATLAAISRERAALTREVARLRDQLAAWADYQRAHRRLLHRVCPGVSEAELVGNAGLRSPAIIDCVDRAIAEVMEERDLLREERNRLPAEPDRPAGTHEQQ